MTIQTEITAHSFSATVSPRRYSQCWNSFLHMKSVRSSCVKTWKWRRRRGLDGFGKLQRLSGAAPIIQMLGRGDSDHHPRRASFKEYTFNQHYNVTLNTSEVCDHSLLYSRTRVSLDWATDWYQSSKREKVFMQFCFWITLPKLIPPQFSSTNPLPHTLPLIPSFKDI